VMMMTPDQVRVISAREPSNYSAQTYVTAAESLLSVPLMTTASNADSSCRTSRSLLCCSRWDDVVNGWSSSDEEGEERRGGVI